MDGELVTGSLSGRQGGGADLGRPPLFRYTEMFEEYCPYYMAIGMTYDEYWHGDNELPRYYRKLFEINTERKSQDMWLQGMYFYDALCRVTPLYDSFSKKRDPVPYIDHPYPLTEATRQLYRQKEQRKKQQDAMEYVRNWAMDWNEHLKE